MTNTPRTFSAKSTNFWLSVLIMFFGVLTVFGVELPANPTDLAGEVIAQLDTAGWVGLLGTFGASLWGVIVQIYDKFKVKTDFLALLGSPNAIIYLAGLVGSIVALYGVGIKAESISDLVAAIYRADYFGALSILIPVLNVVIRYFRDKATVNTVRL